MSERPGPFRHVFGTLWIGITRARIILSNLLFLLVIAMLFLVFRGQSPQPLPARAALLLNPVGTVVEQKSYVEPLAELFTEPLPQEREVLLGDIVDAILLAKDDPRISALVMELDQLYGIGISKTGEVASAIEEFRASGKPVVAWNDSLSQSQYLLASEADTLIIHPMGSVLLEGFANYQWYFADALEKLSVNVHVFKAGEYKSIAEPFLRNDMSAGEKAISQRWLDSAWAHYTDRIERRRELEPGAVNRYINGFAGAVAANGGDLAATALQSGLVDEVMLRSEANQWIASAVGASDDYGSYQAVEFGDYLQRSRPSLQSVIGQPQVAIISARGNISDGDQPAGSIGGDSLGWLIQDAVDDPEIAAIVLRIDSGGGSAFASEIIRQKVLEARRRGKPVVVSMSSVAASGGYWIAAAADEIWATPSTLTGSIGVFGAIPTFESLLERAGVHTDGVATTGVAGAFRTDRPLQPEVSATFQASIDNIYQRFVDLVAEGRELPLPEVYKLANGGVYLGSEALELGLVDHLGGSRDAVAAAARLAGLGEDEYVPISYEEAPSPREELLRQLSGSVGGLAGGRRPGWESTLRSWGAPLRERLRVLENLDDARGIYAHCLVCMAP